jgi:long-chain acyl-CoA synthetase
MMAGATVTYGRSSVQFIDDLVLIRPTLLLTVPRIFEKVYSKIQSELEGKDLPKRLFERTVAIDWQRFLYQQGRISGDCHYFCGRCSIGSWRGSFVLC